MSAPVHREAARVLLLDGRDRLLLLQGGDPSRPDVGLWWMTPGGGIDAGESPEAAALRELREETGLAQAVLGPVVWQRTAEFEFDGVRYRQREVFFLARVPPAHGRPEVEVVHTGWTDLERRAMTGHRWWSLAELAATTEVVYPTVLAAELRRLLADGPPPTPVEVAA